MPKKRRNQPTIRTHTFYRTVPVGWVTWGESPRPITDYTVNIVKRISGFNHPSYVWRDAMNSWCYGNNNIPPSLQAVCMQRAFARFRAKVTDRAEMGLFLAERREAADLITRRLTNLSSAASALSKGNLPGFARRLGVTLKSKHRRRGRWFVPRMFSSIWLEYWFGWAPMLIDIFKAIEVLESPYPIGQARASATVQLPKRVKGTISPYHIFSGTVSWRYSYQADIYLENPLLYRANQLGLINPATILWERVPFSFIVDWFIPVGSFLGIPTEFAGLSLERKFSTMKSSLRSTEVVWNSQNVLVNATFQGTTFSRHVGFSAPKLAWDVPTGLSLTRAATAASLIISLFSPKRA